MTTTSNRAASMRGTICIEASKANSVRVQCFEDKMYPITRILVAPFSMSCRDRESKPLYRSGEQ